MDSQVLLCVTDCMFKKFTQICGATVTFSFYLRHIFKQVFMKKQIILLGAVVVVTVSAWALLTVTPGKKSAAASPKCSKTCEEKPAPNSAPQTGFFIFDSFSGSL